MTNEEIKEILKLYNEFDRKYPVTASFAEHADSDDWKSYWNDAVNYIKKKLVPTAIDEKKLDEIAEKHCEKYEFEPTQRNVTDSGWEYGHTYLQLVDAYKTGYRKAKEK